MSTVAWHSECQVKDVISSIEGVLCMFVNVFESM